MLSDWIEMQLLEIVQCMEARQSSIFIDKSECWNNAAKRHDSSF